MGNKNNLKVLSPEEAREYGRRGGLKSVEARRKKKQMNEALSLLLSLPVKDKKVVKKLKSMGISKEEVNNQTVMLISILQKAFKGDVRAATFIRDTVGEGPNNQSEGTGDPINITFVNDYGDIEEGDEDGD